LLLAEYWKERAEKAEAALPTAEQIEEIKRLANWMCETAGDSYYRKEHEKARNALHAALDALKGKDAA
jgi:lipopolysaccharide biosynthesis regulator YciM